MTFKGHLDYLHCVVARNSTNQIVTGSEDGTARIWGSKAIAKRKVGRGTARAL
uniref:Uncharacterized protein n=1 Tax=Rhizophora mucronata TaxID=61149 RepID=A0A2P2JCA4_RHIMU